MSQDKDEILCFYCEGTGKRGYTDGNTGIVHKNIYGCSHCNATGITPNQTVEKAL